METTPPKKWMPLRVAIRMLRRTQEHEDNIVSWLRFEVHLKVFTSQMHSRPFNVHGINCFPALLIAPNPIKVLVLAIRTVAHVTRILLKVVDDDYQRQAEIKETAEVNNDLLDLVP